MSNYSFLYLFKFNNYYDRNLIHYDTIGEYTNLYREYEIAEEGMQVNFNPKNEIHTEVILNKTNAINFNYLIEVDKNNYQIKSRWFILSTERNNGNQFKLYLRRDVLSDSYKNLPFFDMFIKKGYANDESPFCLAKENFSCNQIKKSSTKIKTNKYNSKGCLIAYIPSDLGWTNSSGEIQSEYSRTLCVVNGISKEITTTTTYQDVLNILQAIDSNITLTEITTNGFSSSYIYTSSAQNVRDTLNNLNSIKNGIYSFGDNYYQIYINCPTDPEYNTSLQQYYYPYSITITLIGAEGGLNVYFDCSSINNCNDQPYNIIGMENTEENIKYLTALYGAGACYDIQIVPYINFNDYGNNCFFYTNNIGGTVLKSCFSLSSYSFETNFSFNIDELIEDFSIKELSNVVKCRLTAPDYSNSYDIHPEFQAYRDYPSDLITNWYVKIDLIPLSCRVKLYYNYKGITGSNFNDTQALIFTLPSISLITDNWTTYQLNNKNYENIFNRQIADMKYQRKWNVSDDIINTIISTGESSAIGSLFGVGAISGIGSFASGVYNTAENISKTNRQIRTAQKNFKYNIENIQAQPNSLSRATNIYNDYLIYPVLEIFTCTDEEFEQFDKYLLNNGYTLNVVGTIENFVNSTYNYFEAEIIKKQYSNNFGYNSLWVQTLNEELSNGIFVRTIDW